MNSPSVPPQLTVKAILLGLILSVVLAGANAYLGLFAGMTVGRIGQALSCLILSSSHFLVLLTILTILTILADPLTFP